MEKKEVTFVLFGGTGDLTKKKLVPAIANLVHEGKIREDSTIIGISRKKMSHEQYKKYLVDSIKDKGDKEYIGKLDIKFFNGDFDKGGLKGLNELMTKCELDGCNRICYLSTGFRFFPSIVKELKRQGLENVKKGFTRIVFEKPFGNDLESSEELDKEIHKVFSEDNVFRLDHYLAKETAQNLNVLKFTNPILYSTFNKEFIESIEIIVDEDLDVGSRIEYYNHTGAIKDMIQSHLLQLLSLLLMERPDSLKPEKIHDEKAKILRNIEVMPAKYHLLGQYESYSEEAKKASLNPDGIESFARIELNCKTKRWNGVKLVLRTGKKLKRKYGQIKINYKGLKNFEHGLSNIIDNQIIIDIYPKQDVSMLMNTRHPDNFSCVKQVKFEFCRECEFGPNTKNEYAVLLGEVIKGDKMLFTRSDEIRESWKIVEKIEKMRDKIKFVKYKDGGEPEEV